MRRTTAGVLTTLGLVAGLGLAGWQVQSQVEPAYAEIGQCPPGTIPGPSNDNPVWTDNNVSVYAGRDFTSAGGAAEVEGVLVAKGDADISKTGGGRFNVGWVGVGSGVVPSPGSVMLAVGGDLRVHEGVVLDVGARATSPTGGGGSVTIGGVSDPDYELDGSRYELNGGSLTEGMGAVAVAPWAGWGTLISDSSAGYAALPGAPAVVGGQSLTFAGDGSAQQVFTVSAADLSTHPEISFTDIAEGASVIVNVTGGPVTWAPNYFGDDGQRADDPASGRFGAVAARTLWNFVDATSVTIGGSSQVLGSVLVPGDAGPDVPTVAFQASLNGRLYTNGSILMNGSGNELHNYPFVDAPFECIPNEIVPRGAISVTKRLSPEDAGLLPPGALFHGIVVCEGTESQPGQTVAEWSVGVDQTTVIDDLPVGATCLMRESVREQVRSRAPLLFGAPPDATVLEPWQTPQWFPSDTVIVPSGQEPAAELVVTNSIQRGAFTIEKILDAGDSGFDGSLTIDYSCTPSGIAGSVPLRAGERSSAITAPVGDSCAVSEPRLPAPPAGWQWGTPQVSGAPAVITADSIDEPIAVTVTNTLTPIAPSATGSFTIRKDVVDASGIGVTGTFTGAVVCVADGATTTYPWSLGAGQTSPATSVPVGSVCTVTETTPEPPTGGVWDAAVISPATFTVDAAGTEIAVTVTNTLRPVTPVEPVEPGDPGTSGLPSTGGTVPWWAIAAGGVLVVGGAGALLIAGRRRRRG